MNSDIVSFELEQLKKATECRENDIQSLIDKSIEIREKTPENVILGYSSGFPSLDKITDGIQKGRFYMLGARSSHGKSMVSVTLMKNFLVKGAKGLFFSLEMSDVQVVNRLLAAASGARIYDYSKKTESTRIQKGYDEMKDTVLEVIHDIRNINDIVSYTKYKIHKGECDFIVVDYMQNLSDVGYRDNYTMLKEASYRFQSLSIQHNVAILALSQLNEDGSFKGAKNMYEASDVSMIVERERDDFGDLKKESKFIVTKNRHGRVGRFDIVFNESCNQVNELYNHYK